MRSTLSASRLRPASLRSHVNAKQSSSSSLLATRCATRAATCYRYNSSTAASTSSAASKQGALTGIKIVDLSRVLAVSLSHSSPRPCTDLQSHNMKKTLFTDDETVAYNRVPSAPRFSPITAPRSQRSRLSAKEYVHHPPQGTLDSVHARGQHKLTLFSG